MGSEDFFRIQEGVALLERSQARLMMSEGARQGRGESAESVSAMCWEETG